MRTPVIGITSSQQGIRPEPGGSYVHYCNAVRNLGGEPHIIGLDQPLEELDALVASLDGLILSGGGDVQTRLYQGDETQPVEDVLKDRDTLELGLINKVLAADLPLMGICRGLQVLNVALGGKLITHIPTQFPTTIQHSNPYPQNPRELIAHEVALESGSRLAAIYNIGQVQVNSRHHQAVDEIAAGCQVTAHATDSLIEALEVPDARFVLGVQWHPENLQAIPAHQRLFKAFITACGV